MLRLDVDVRATDLLQVPEGKLTEAGLRQNLDVGIQYLEAWLSGNGCVPLHDLMEDAATAEISRVQLWQWLHHGASLDNGRRVDAALIRTTLAEVLASLQSTLGPATYEKRRFDLASTLFLDMVLGKQLPDFLTTVAYEHI